MPKPSGSDPPPKSKKRKLDKTKLRSKKKKPSPQEELSNVCNITGIGIRGDDADQGLGGLGDDFEYGGLVNELECLNELATAQFGGSSPSTAAENNEDSKTSAENRSSQNPQTPPPTLYEIPNLRVELARHLQAETLSTFLLQSCPGLRMPTF